MNFSSIIATLTKIKEAAWARISLRRCNEVGPLTRARGRMMVSNQGKIRLGRSVNLNGRVVPVELSAGKDGVIEIGDFGQINHGTCIVAEKSVIIGKNCGIGSYSIIMDTDFHMASDFKKRPEPAPVTIGDDVWLATRVTVLKGVTIGNGAVVSAGSVVVADVPPYTMVGGVPARIIKRLPSPASEAAEIPAAEALTSAGA